MKNSQSKEALNVYLAEGEFNISQFHLRQSLSLQRHNIKIEFGILQNNYFIRLEKNNDIFNEICTTIAPVLHKEKIFDAQNFDQKEGKITKKLLFADYTFEFLISDLHEGNKGSASLQGMTNKEDVYKLSHLFPLKGSTSGDTVELYLDLNDSIQLKTMRVCSAEGKILFTSSKIDFF